MTTHRSTGEWSLAVRQQASVARLGQLGLRGVDLDDLLVEALDELADTLGVSDVALLELLDGGQEFRVRAVLHGGVHPAARAVRGVRVPAGRESLPGYTVLQGGPVVSTDLQGDDRFTARSTQYGISSHSAIAAPVGWGERPWGVVALYSDAARDWSDDDAHFVQSMANTIGLAISRQRVEAELRDSSARLDLSLAAGGLGAWTWDVHRNAVSLSGSALALVGLDHDGFDGTGDAYTALVHPDDRAALRTSTYGALDHSGEHHSQYRVRRRSDDSIRWFESWARVLYEGGRPSRLVGVLADVTDRRRAEEFNQALLAREQRARAEAELARERLGLLAEAGSRFARSLDPDVVVGALAELCVPLLADVSVVDLLGDDGELQHAAGTAVEDHLLEQFQTLRARRTEPDGHDRTWSSAEVAASGRSALVERLTAAERAAVAADAEHLAMLEHFGARSAMVVPLLARDRVIGVLTLIATRPGRDYDLELLALVEELAARAALALDNGRLFASRNRVARSLQAALLPPALPSVTGLDLATRYEVGEADTEIGGDFYDVIEMGERTWGVVVGDVCGRGPDAAALTGLMRHSVRTAVIRESRPSRVLAQTNDAVLAQIDDARFCTATYLRLEVGSPSGGTVRGWASSAGHPRPAVLRADGTAELLDCAGVLLGVVAAPTLVDVSLTLEPGDSVVLYTDGVTEARCGRDQFGEDRLLHTLRGLAGLDAEAIAAGLEHAVERFRSKADDDVAIVVVGVPRPGDSSTH